MSDPVTLALIAFATVLVTTTAQLILAFINARKVTSLQVVQAASVVKADAAQKIQSETVVKVDEIHKQTNSMKDQLIAATGAVREHEGRVQGIRNGRVEADLANVTRTATLQEGHAAGVKEERDRQSPPESP